MTIQLTKEDADKGQYGYCIHCSGLRTARWQTPVVLHAGGDPILAPIMVTLPEFCTCMEQLQHFWGGRPGLEKDAVKQE